MTAPDTAPLPAPVFVVYPDAPEIFEQAAAEFGALHVVDRVPSLRARPELTPPVLVVPWDASDATAALAVRLRSAPAGLVVVGLCDGAEEAGFWAAAASLPALASTAPRPPSLPALRRALRSALTVQRAVLHAEAARARAEAELAKVLYSVSHDLRAPTQGLVGLAGLLAETEASRLTPEGREVCAEIERSGQRLSSMVDALAICSRTERQTLALGPVALQPLVEAIFASAIAAHQTRFPRLSLDPALPEIVSDTELLTAILRATVDNAIRYNSSNPPRVHVGVEAGDDTAEITVVDNGATLTELERGAVFELFTRLAPRQSDGVGAGLTIARMAARRLGGELRVEPAPQGGNSFILSLPILDADSPG